MKILGIVCSPRTHGNTEIMLEAALAGAREGGVETELLSLAGKRISPCDGCNSCAQTGRCHTKDEMQDIYEKLLESDGVIVGSPVYYWNVTAQAKALIDRTCVFSHEKRLKGKLAGSIVTIEGSGGSTVVSVLNGFFMLQRMIVIGYAIGRSGAEGYSNKEAIRKDIFGMEQAEELGQSFVEYITSRKDMT